MVRVVLATLIAIPSSIHLWTLVRLVLATLIAIPSSIHLWTRLHMLLQIRCTVVVNIEFPNDLL